ncbi:MAG: M56 family metallopeptidase [Bacteroidota bacterium]
MIPYILHVATLLACFYILYKLLLEKETFFGLHRYILVAAIVLSFSLPLYQVPPSWSLWQTEATLEETDYQAEMTFSEESTSTFEKNAAEKVEKEISMPPSEIAVTESSTTSKTSLFKNLSIWQILWTIYWIGVAIFSIHFFLQLATLVYKIIRLPSMKDGRYRIVELERDEPPYSFLNCIFIHPEKYDWETYNQIIAHEKVHIQQLHSFDMILAELLVVFQWFNPAAWQYRKMIENNLEFLTDQSMLLQGVARKTYQLNLLKVSVPQHPIGLAMNYNQSTLKKRIKMMNAKKSSVRSSWKYLAILPILGLSIIFLNNTKAQSIEVAVTETVPIEQDISALTEIVPVTAIEAIVAEQVSTMIEPALEAEPIIEEVAILEEKINEIDDFNEYHLNISSTAEEALYDLKGFWQAQIEDNSICVRFDNSDLKRRNIWMTTECFELREFDTPPNGKGTFTISRAAGKIVMTGEMEDDYGQGRYTFESSGDFKNYLSKKGIKELDDKYMFHLFTADISPAYFDFLKKEGITDISKKELRDLAIHGLDMEYMQENLAVFKEKGFDDVSLRELVELKIHNVNKEYIEEMASIGFDDLSLADLKSGSIHNVDVDYVKEIRGMGYDHLTFKDFVAFSIHNVDEDLVASLAEVGFKNLPADKLKSASIHNVSPRYINELKKAGYDLKDIDDLIRFKIHNVDADFIGRMNELGYNNLSAQDITNAAIHNVRIKDVEALRKMGYDDLTIREVINLSIHNVDADYVEDLRALGYTDLSIQKVTNAKIHNVRPSFIKELNELGFQAIPFNEVVNLKIHNVTPEFIERARAKGMTDLSLKEYKKLKIHGILR